MDEESKDRKLLQPDTEPYNCLDLDQVDQLEVEESDGSGVLTLEKLQEEVIDDYEYFTSKLAQMFELECGHIDSGHKSYESVINLNKQLRQEIMMMKERNDQATQILNKLKALFE